MHHKTPSACVATLLLSLAGTGITHAQAAPDLARYFGFAAPRIVVVGDGCGPAVAADFNKDGLTDLAVVNNRKSRIEIFTQRRAPLTEAQRERDFKVNTLPPNPWFDKTEISVAHRIGALQAFDVDGDGDMDIVYAGQPAEVVVLEQRNPLNFEVGVKRRIPDLSAGQDGLAIANVSGDARPELLVLAAGRIHVYSFNERGPVGEPLKLGSSGDLVAFFIEDYNGDGRQDILGVIPDDRSPLRLWLQEGSARAGGRLGAEIRMEMPELREVEPVRFPGRAAASINVIESASRRIVMYDVVEESINATDLSTFGGEVDAVAEVQAFRNEDKDRAVAIGDVTGDGRVDLLATDASANSLVLYVQGASGGLDDGESYGTFKKPNAVAIGQWDGAGTNEVIVLSTEEKTVGVSHWDANAQRLDFPRPLPIATAGAEPVAMGYLDLDTGPAVAVVVREKRDHVLEVHRPTGAPVVLELKDVNRPPNSMLAGDFDHDGDQDLILFTPNEPMVMVTDIASTDAETIRVLTDDDMPQFGLVSAAGPENTALFDIDGDRAPELLIADENFVRACTFDAGNAGWRVVEQITMPEAAASLKGLAVLEMGQRDLIVAADASSSELIMMAQDDRRTWQVARRLRLSGFTLGPIRAGSFHGSSGDPDILCLSSEAFSFVRMSGRHVALEEFAAYRSDEDARLEHETEAGDLNGDGYVDMVVLDAREQMCQIFTFSASRKLYMATEFEVFQSMLFRGGDTREFQPSAAIIADLTGDGAADLCLAVHDRYIIYPQETR